MRALYLYFIILFITFIISILFIILLFFYEGAVPVLVGLVHVRLGVLQQLLHHLNGVEMFSLGISQNILIQCGRTFPDLDISLVLNGWKYLVLEYLDTIWEDIPRLGYDPKMQRSSKKIVFVYTVKWMYWVERFPVAREMRTSRGPREIWRLEGLYNTIHPVSKQLQPFSHNL